jgi:hypothetical protein
VFFTRLEEAVNVGPCALAQHLNHYGRDVFTKLTNLLPNISTTMATI